MLPALILGVAWMQQSGVPAVVYGQNIAAAIAGLALAAYGLRRHAPPSRGLAVVAVACVLLLATLAVDGVQGVHRWIRLGPVTVHVASLSLPIVLAEVDRMLRSRRIIVACVVMLTVVAILAIQPDAGQATAFAGAGISLLGIRLKTNRVAIAGTLALLGLSALSFLRSDPVAPVAHVEEIAVRIGQRGTAWQAAVLIALAFLIVPFIVRTVRASTPAGFAIAVYLALVIAASFWGNFPVPILGYGMSPIIGYCAGWTWLRASRNEPTTFVETQQ